MGDKLMFTKKAGDANVADVTDQLGDSPDCKATLHYDVPDVVRLPQDLGGYVVRVTGSKVVACPCGRGPVHCSRILFLAEATGICVIECSVTRQFMWVRVPADHLYRAEGTCYPDVNEDPREGETEAVGCLGDEYDSCYSGEEDW